MNIIDIARLAGVSTATVSRALNGSDKVRPKTAAHVKRIIAKVHYVPNTSARVLRVGKSMLFGLIVSDIKNPFFPELIDKFEALAVQQGIDVIFTHTNYDPARQAHALRRLVERNVDAIAVMTSEISLKGLEAVKVVGTPMVLLNQLELAPNFNNVAVDYISGFGEAVAHLKELGHRGIGYLAGPASLSSALCRTKAFHAAMQAARLPVKKQWIAVGDFHIEGGYAAMTQLLRLNNPPGAVIAANDMMAVGALQAANALKVPIPKRLSLIGFDNLNACTMLTPSLTSIAVSRDEIAVHAFEMLFRESSAKRKSKAQLHTIQTRLITRQSTGRPVK
jgi:LacI family transcriptional regulator